MATPVGSERKHFYIKWGTLYELDLKYVSLEYIGEGGYGTVCSCINRETNERVAIKKIQNVFENRVEALRALREMKLLRHLRHENVICLKDVMKPRERTSFKDVYLVLELMDTDLETIIMCSQTITNDQCQHFLFQLLKGLQYLHSANILHRDLKPDNLLVNENSDLKICDFGLARANNNDGMKTVYVATRWYRAPELLIGCENYGTAVDVWSVGCILAELLGKTPIFQGTDCLDQLKLIVEILGTQKVEEDLEFIDDNRLRLYIRFLPYSRGTPFSHLYPSADPLAIDLLEKMLVFNPTKRISATQALQHPYMASLYDPNSDPPLQAPLDLDIDTELGKRMIREMMWNEMLHYHPDQSL